MLRKTTRSALLTRVVFGNGATALMRVHFTLDIPSNAESSPMKRFLLCLLAAVPLTAPCAEHKWYTHVALSDAGPNVATGFHLTKAFSLEVGYRDLHGEGWEVAARAEKHVSPRLSVTGRLGAYDSKEMTIRVRPDANGQVDVQVGSHGGTHPSVGLGLKLDISPRWAAFTEFVAVPGLDLGRDSNSTLLVGLSVAY